MTSTVNLSVRELSFCEIAIKSNVPTESGVASLATVYVNIIGTVNPGCTRTSVG